MYFKEALESLVGSREVGYVPFDRAPVNRIITSLKKDFGVTEYTYDANGFNVDFWIEFTLDGARFCVSGDLWYKETFEVSLIEE